MSAATTRALALLLLAAGPALTAAGQSLALRARAVYPATAEQPGPIPGGMVLIRDGRIAAVGADLELDPATPVIDLPDAYICPGLVDAGGLSPRRSGGDESASGAYHAAAEFDPFGDYAELLAQGVTTIYLHPGEGRLVGGVGAVARLAGTPDERLLRGQADLAIDLGTFDPPLIGERPTRAAADVAIEPFARQRPSSRLGQFYELDRWIAAVDEPQPHNVHRAAFAEAWKAGLPLRFDARRGLDLAATARFLERHQRGGYLIGATEGDDVAAALARAGLPVVWRIDDPFDRPTYNAGDNPEALVTRIETPARLLAAGVPVALTGRSGEQTDLALVAALAMRGGLSRTQALAAVTRVPAEVLGVGDRVGSLAPGRDADLLILSGPPLDLGARVTAAYVRGERVYDAAQVHAAIADESSSAGPPLVVRAGTIWLGDGRVLHDAELLAEDGEIRAVGQRVPHPPLARFVDAGPDAFVTPGFIDAHSHLGLEGDRSGAGPELPIEQVVGVADRQFARVARSGVTTVLLSSYGADRNGSRIAAVKTWGADRAELLTRAIAGLRFSLDGADPLNALEPLEKLLERARKYEEAWKKYDEQLNKWRAGELKPEEAEAKPKEAGDKPPPDPLTGTWEYTLSGGPIPEPRSGTMLLRLTGTEVAGRLSGGLSDEEIELSGTFDGKDLVLEVDRETPMGPPRIEATLEAADTLRGELRLGSILTLAFEANRTDAGPVDFKVRRGRRGEDGRPAAPAVEENLEPFRAVLAGRAAIVIEAAQPAVIRAAVEFFKQQELPLVVLGAADAAPVADLLAARSETVGVVPPARLAQSRDDRPYVPIVDLAGRGVKVAFQSDSEDGARNLPWMALYAVRAGLGGDAALRALTCDAARMFRLDDRVGTLQVGRDADIVIHSGYPFDAASRIERVFIRGQEAILE